MSYPFTESSYRQGRSRPVQKDLPLKNRVWDFFEERQNCVGKNDRFAQCSCWENRPTPTKPVSGRRDGNISDYVTENGSIAAHYEYDPYGNVIRESGPEADAFVYKFSTKYEDEETGLYYYGFRYYKPDLGRFINRDPIEEMGGMNLYGFVGNNPINDFDILGLAHFCCPDELEAVQAQYLACVRGVIQNWRTCKDNARTVRDVALEANQQAHEDLKESIRKTANSCRRGCERQFPDQPFARSGCIFLCDVGEGEALVVAYAAYVVQRGVIHTTYVGLIAYCDHRKAVEWEDCKDAARGVCTNFSP